jgi:hypothetical protein
MNKEQHNKIWDIMERAIFKAMSEVDLAAYQLGITDQDRAIVICGCLEAVLETTRKELPEDFPANK